MKKFVMSLLVALFCIGGVVGPNADALTLTIGVGDQPYYVHGPGYWAGGVYYVWVPGHWVWRRHHRVWIHGHYRVR